MNSRGHSLFPIIVLLLLAGVSVWLDRVTQQEETVKTDKTRHEPDFTADKLTLRRFDLTGKTQYILVADRMIHYGDDESTELVRPRLDYLNRPEPVRMESDFATVSKDGDTVVLNDNVYLRRAAQPASPNPPSAPNA
jgi:lipopolysaccharide export system protein LptC